MSQINNVYDRLYEEEFSLHLLLSTRDKMFMDNKSQLSTLRLIKMKYDLIFSLAFCQTCQRCKPSYLEDVTFWLFLFARFYFV